MGQEYHGTLVVKPEHRFGILVSRFNSFLTQQLLAGAKDMLTRHGAGDDQMDVIYVPGSYELALVAKKLAATRRYHALICLGAVIRGDTPHFEYVASQTARGIAQVGLETNLPVIFGVVTADTLEQAVNRAGVKAGNKGADAAATAVEVVNLLESIR